MDRQHKKSINLSGAIIALSGFVIVAIAAEPAVAASGSQIDANPLFLLLPLAMLGGLIVTELARQIGRRSRRLARTDVSRWRPGQREG